MREKSYIAVPVWVATPFLVAVIAYFGWLTNSILDLRANVAGLQGKVDILSSAHQLAKHE